MQERLLFIHSCDAYERVRCAMRANVQNAIQIELHSRRNIVNIHEERWDTLQMVHIHIDDGYQLTTHIA